MKKMSFPLFSDSSKARTPSNLALQILIFFAVFIVIYLAQSIFASFFVLPEMFRAMDKAGVFDNAASFGYNEIYDIAMSVSMQDNVLIPTLYATVFGIILSIVHCRFIEKRSLSSMGFRPKKIIPRYFEGLLAGIALMSAITGISVLTGVNSICIEDDINAGIILLYFSGFFIQGASEEIIFRGYLMNSVGGKHSVFTALAVSSIAFALAHIANPGITLLAFLNLVLFAVFAGLYIICFDDIWGACAIHSIWNFTQGNIFGISVSGTGSTPSIFRTTAESDIAWLTGGNFGIEGSIITTVVLIAASLLVVVRMKRTQNA